MQAILFQKDETEDGFRTGGTMVRSRMDRINPQKRNFLKK